MCDPDYSKQKNTSAPLSTNSVKASAQPQQVINLYTTHTHNALSQPVNTVYLQTAFGLASRKNSSKSLYVRMVLDGGSQMSFIKSSVARQLDLDIIGVQNVNIIPFGSKEPTPSMQCNKVQVMLRNQYNNRAVLLELMEVPEICVNVLSAPDKNLKTIKELLLADVRMDNLHAEDGISILIGADNYWLLATGQHKRITSDLTAINTILGWTLQGRSPVISHNSDVAVNLSCVTSLHACVCEDLQQFWRLETLGITNDKKESICQGPLIRKVGDRYEASLPWKDVGRVLQDNRMGALCRMHSLVRKLRVSGRLKDYEACMLEMVNSGLAERVEEDEQGDRVYYMPHRPVYRDDKDTTKLRIVFDATAHATNNLSLNDHLEVGNNHLPEILTVLLNFRCGKIGLTADIEKAFLQIVLSAPDRESHRFFWFKELFNPNETRRFFSASISHDTSNIWCNQQPKYTRGSNFQNFGRWKGAISRGSRDSTPMFVESLLPRVVRLKIHFQSIWRQNLDWDVRLPADLDKIWIDCCADVSELGQITLPRCLIKEEGSTQIHIYADASQYAFGAVAYLRTTDDETAALVAARLLGYLRVNLQIKFDEEFLWTDSRIALFWILGKEKRWKPYVENRVREIRTLTKISCWRHCPGSQNPADLVTRGINALTLTHSTQWLSGPDWLQHESTIWPAVNEDNSTTLSALSFLVAAEGEEEESTNFNNSFINCRRFSTWRRLLRITAYCFRAIEVFKNKRRSDTLANLNDIPFLGANEMDRAEKYWIGESQRLHFNSEIVALRSKQWSSSGRRAIAYVIFSNRSSSSNITKIVTVNVRMRRD